MKFITVPGFTVPQAVSLAQAQLQLQAKTFAALIAAHAGDARLIAYAHIRARLGVTDAQIDAACAAAGVAVVDDNGLA